MTSGYDLATIDRLVACHGPARAALIIAGKDGPTNRDIATWDRLRRHTETPFAQARRAMEERDAKIVRLYRSGVDPILIGERLGLDAVTVALVLKPTFGRVKVT